MVNTALKNKSYIKTIKKDHRKVYDNITGEEHWERETTIRQKTHDTYSSLDIR